MIDLVAFPLRYAVFSLASVPRGNISKDALPVLFRELQRRAIARPDLAHWAMHTTGLQVAVTHTADEDGKWLVLELLRALPSLSPRDVSKFGAEVSAALALLALSRQVVRSHIDDRRHVPEPCLRYLTLLAPKGATV